MDILNLTFKDSRPDIVSIELTVEQAAHITKLLGKISPASAESPASYEAQSNLYHLFTGCLFNRYWDDGINGYLRGENE